MKKTFTNHSFYLITLSSCACILTFVASFALFVLSPFSHAYASYEDITPSTSPMIVGRPVDTVAADEDARLPQKPGRYSDAVALRHFA
jgi:hypothetical protein